MNSLPKYPTFDYDVDKTNAGPRWEKYVNRLENLFIGMNLKDDARKRALLLHYVGEAVYDIYEAEKGSTAATYDETKKVLTAYFKPKRNIQMEIFNFRSCKQKANQSLDDFVTELRQLAKNCEFTNTDHEILSQVIQHCSSSRLRKRALREPDKSLKDILELGRSLELADTQAAAIEDESVNSIHRPRPPNNQKPRTTPTKTSHPTNNQRNKPLNTQTTCRNCGGQYPHNTACPAKGKTCNYCKKPNHFKTVCNKLKRRQQVNNMSSGDKSAETDSNDSDDYCYTIHIENEVVNTVKQPLPKVSLKLNNINTSLLIDTGSTVNIIDEETYQKLGKPKLKKSKEPNLYSYGTSNPLHVLGQCELLIETKNKIQCHTFFITKGQHGSLIGYPTAQALHLVKILQHITDPTSKYPNLFKGIGKLKDTQVKIHIDESVKPVAQKPRRVPFHLRDKVEQEIDKLLEEDIIEKVQGDPTPWVSPIVIVPKKDSASVRICVDMRKPNQAIIRERHQMPTVEELTSDLNGAKIFSKIDLTSGYHQLELTPESRSITTFNTHIGLFRYKRLNFGISSASEIFQETIRNVIHDIPNARNISDDIIVFGSTQEQHDKTLDAVFNRLHDKGLTVNKNKCLFNQDRITFFGLVFSSEGVSPDPSKIEAIQHATRPTNVTEVKSFLGMTNYCSRFIKGYATISEPLRRLTKTTSTWCWSDEQETAFCSLKDSLTSTSVMKYFDPQQELKIIVDASPVGLGGILTQDNHVLSYASRSLTDVESRYSQTEREALAIVWACEHFNMYTNGARHFTVITDHKPLENIWKKANPTPRIQRWALRLQPYNFTIVYQPGSTNPSDYLSRHPESTGPTCRKTSLQERVAEQYVNFLAFTSTPRSMTLDDIKKETKKDKTMQKVMSLVRSSRWHEVKTINDPNIDSAELQLFYNIKDELVCHADNVLLRNNLIVIPPALRSQAIEIAHEGHQGINRTKAFIRSKIWFPRIDDRVEDTIKSCIPCQAATYANTSSMEPLQMSAMPENAWENLSADFCGPLPTGEYLFVITDEHSRYPVVEIIKSISANTVIPILDKVLSQFGCPKVIKTDNGAPFNSLAFANYAKYIGFVHRKITPLWPRANAQAESFNKPIMKSIRTARLEGKNWHQEMYKFLRQYRSTPHPSTKFPPFQLLFGRTPTTKLPEIANKADSESAVTTQAKLNDKSAKDKAKQYADRRNKAKDKDLKIGDKVLVKSEKMGNKFTTPYQPEPHTILAKKGSMLTAASNDRVVTRNASFFKKIKEHADDKPSRKRTVPKYLEDFVRY